MAGIRNIQLSINCANAMRTLRDKCTLPHSVLCDVCTLPRSLNADARLPTVRS